jgi:hypothetical protein
MNHKVTTTNFSLSTDAQIIEAARELLAKASSINGAQRKLIRSKKPDVNVAGKYLWAHLCGWSK